MRSWFFKAALVILIILPMSRGQAQEATITPGDQLVFISPNPGQALQGTVLIVAESNFDSPANIQLSFSYADDPRETWFLIQEFQEISQQELRVEWNTTTITDGNYVLRLSAQLDQGMTAVYRDGLRVRNYTVVETNTPVPTFTPAPQDTSVPTATPIKTSTAVPPTATELPPNPAQITNVDIWGSILQGALITLSLFVILGVIQFFRQRRRRKE